MTGSPLDSLAREFAADISTLLNRTVADGVRISAVLSQPDLFVAAAGIGKRDLRPNLIPLTLGRKNPRAFLLAAYVLEMDQEGSYLTVNKSQVGLYATAELRSMIFHYDYNRVTSNKYPSAHFQVAGQSGTLADVVARSPAPETPLRDLHFPVGGRRFRPTLEDVVEFLIVEDLVDFRPGWEEAIAERREVWKEIQLKAAVRRYPEWAAATLRACGYSVS